MYRRSVHREVVDEVVRTLRNRGYVVKTEAWASTSLGYRSNSLWREYDLEEWYRSFSSNVANMLLGSNSPWISLHNPEFQTRLDVVGLYYADLERVPLHTFFVRKDPKEVALRTILVEIEHRHSLEEAVERIRGYPAGKKIIVWTRGSSGGVLDDIPILIARNEGFGWYITGLLEILDEHAREVSSLRENKEV